MYFIGDLQEDLDEMLEQTLNFIRRNIATKIIIDDNGKRENVPEYPMKALREAVANALIHRDYSISRESAYIYVQIYNDRIEIINPGDLYGNNRLENLGTDMMLESRNKNIIRLLEEKGNIIENRHTGIATMREEMKKMGMPEPEFQSLRGDFKVIFRKEIIKNNIIKEENGQKVDRRWTESGQKKWTEKSGQKMKNNILLLITERPDITQKEIIQILNVGRTTVTNNIRKLKQENKIKRVGSDRKGYWQILDDE